MRESTVQVQPIQCMDIDLKGTTTVTIQRISILNDMKIHDYTILKDQMMVSYKEIALIVVEKDIMPLHVDSRSITKQVAVMLCSSRIWISIHKISELTRLITMQQKVESSLQREMRNILVQSLDQ